jgi:hypothetical protein
VSKLKQVEAKGDSERKNLKTVIESTEVRATQTELSKRALEGSYGSSFHNFTVALISSLGTFCVNLSELVRYIKVPYTLRSADGHLLHGWLPTAQGTRIITNSGHKKLCRKFLMHPSIHPFVHPSFVRSLLRSLPPFSFPPPIHPQGTFNA